MADGQQQTQTFDPDAFHQDYVQKSGGGAGFDPDSFHEQFTGGGTDRQSAIKQKHGLPASADLSKGMLDPANKEVRDPEAFSRAYEEFNPPAAKPHGFFSNLWGEAKNLFHGATSEPSPFGATDVPLLEQPASEFARPPIETAKSLVHGDLKGAGKNALRSVPIVGPMAVERGEQFSTDPWGAVGAGLTDVLALTSPKWAPEVLGGTADLLDESRESVAERVARPTVSKPFKAAKADIVHGHAPERAVVGEKISSAADAQARMTQIGQALDNTLIKPEHAGKTVDVQPIIDAAYEKAATNARRAGELGAITRLDAVREALETQHGELGKSPRAAAQMYRDIRKMGVKYGPDPERNIVIQFKKDIADSISSEVKRQVPEARPLMERYGDAASAKEAMEPREIMRRQKGILSATKEGLEEAATRKAAQFIGKQYPKSTLDVPAGRTEPPTLPTGRPSITGGGPNEPPAGLRGRRTSTGAIFEEKPTLEEGAGPLARTEGANPKPALEAAANKQPVMVRMLGEPSRGRAIKLGGETQSVTGGRPIIPGERFALPEAPLEQTETAPPKSALTGVDRAKARVRLAELDKQWDTLNSRLSRSRNYSGSKKTIAKLRSISPERNTLRQQFGLGSSEELGEAADPSATYNGLDEDRRAYVDAWAKEIPHLPEILHRETMNELKAFGDPYTPLKERIAKQLLDYESRKGSRREPGEEGPEEPLEQNPSSATAESIRAAQSVTRKTRQSNRHDWRRERGY